MTRLAVFFPYFGAKYMRAPKYPAPMHDLIIEPCAGAAGYAVRHHTKQVLLIDANEKVCGVWDYLIRASAEEIMTLPLLEPGQDIHALSVIQEAKWLMGFWCNSGSATPKRRLGRASNRRSGAWGAFVRERLARQVDSIRHWRVQHGDYSIAPDVTATWFVDPTYQEQGRHYPNRITDFDALAVWCKSRKGQVLVCESQGATWLPFAPVTTVAGSTHRITQEMLWTSNNA